MIAYAYKNLGIADLCGTRVYVRKRLSGWPDGLKFWVTEWKLVDSWLKLWFNPSPWHTASEYEMEQLGLLEKRTPN